MTENYVVIITTAREYHALHSWLEAMEQKEAVLNWIKLGRVTPPFTENIKLVPGDRVCYHIDMDEEVTWNVSIPANISVVFIGSSTVVHHRGNIEAHEHAHVKCRLFNERGVLPQTPGTVVLRDQSSLETLDMLNVGTHVIAHDFVTWRSHGGMDVRADGCTRGWAANSTVQLDGNAAATASFASSIRADGNSVVWTQDPSMVEVVGLGAHVQTVGDLFGETDSFDD